MKIKEVPFVRPGDILTIGGKSPNKGKKVVVMSIDSYGWFWVRAKNNGDILKIPVNGSARIAMDGGLEILMPHHTLKTDSEKSLTINYPML